ncbi:hypothetical protein DXG03_008866 [Asterophora parasitica]|uniref:Uncharacterized protein n=1 Tax=Asterophora parasitica TaxID=117018 RepID=A0A9P7KB68_9AGAR|nr:hypothetical protein DXG03_008866 [Asterophora parasitica]
MPHPAKKLRTSFRGRRSRRDSGDLGSTEAFDVLRASISNGTGLVSSIFDLPNPPNLPSFLSLASSTRSISLSVARTGCKPLDDEYKLPAQHLDPNSSFEILGTISRPYLFDADMTTLANGLEDLQIAGVDLQRCDKLTLHFPGVGSSTAKTHILSEFKKLRDFTFKGDVRELKALLDGAGHDWLAGLTSLTIHGEISLNDCHYLLSQGLQRLKHFQVDVITDSVHPHFGSQSQRQSNQMAELETLRVSSDMDVQPLLNDFSFPRLKKIDLSMLSEAKVDELDVNLPFAALSEVRLQCNMGENLGNNIRQRAPNAKHTHVIYTPWSYPIPIVAPLAARPHAVPYWRRHRSGL